MKYFSDETAKIGSEMEMNPGKKNQLNSYMVYLYSSIFFKTYKEKLTVYYTVEILIFVRGISVYIRF
jgi:hypothetical protein